MWDPELFSGFQPHFQPIDELALYLVYNNHSLEADT